MLHIERRIICENWPTFYFSCAIDVFMLHLFIEKKEKKAEKTIEMLKIWCYFWFFVASWIAEYYTNVFIWCVFHMSKLPVGEYRETSPIFNNRLCLFIIVSSENMHAVDASIGVESTKRVLGDDLCESKLMYVYFDSMLMNNSI